MISGLRTILHSDMNNFFASVECALDPSLIGHPIAVCGDPAERHGIVLAKNYDAKRYGVKTGEALWQAKMKCPGLLCVAPHYKKYEEYSLAAREIYSKYTDLVESYGIDECWLDVTASKGLFGDGVTIANEIRDTVKRELGVTASVGVSFNKVFAKLGSDMKKPDATTLIDFEHFKEIVWHLPVEDLLYVGRSTKERLNRYGIKTIGHLALTPLDTMRLLLGKSGEMLWSFANGLDMSPVSNIAAKSLIKSVSCGNTSHRDLVTDDDVRAALYPLCTTVSSRLRKYAFMCETIRLSVRDFELYTITRQKKLPRPDRTSSEIFKCAHELFLRHHTSGKPVRSMSVTAADLIYKEEIQLSLDPELMRLQRRELAECACDKINERYGKNTICRAIYLAEPELTHLHIHSGVENIMPGMMKMQ
ncbi:MAG: DNA polymerase IV [Clostridia bacterium]|nr:DNA polymerase IV [Clostridia bacterium]